MWSSTWRVTHVFLTLSAVACCAWLLWHQHGTSEPEQHPDPEPAKAALHSDSAVRTFLNLKSMDGDYRLPEGENYGVIALLSFEDGKFRGRRGAWQISGSPEGTRTVSYQIVWGRGMDGGTQMAVVINTPRRTLFYQSKITDDLFDKLEGGDGFVQSSGSLSEEVRGYRVLSYRFSPKTRVGKEQFRGRDEGVQFILDTRQTVAVLGVKTFPTSEQASDWLFHRERADP